MPRGRPRRQRGWPRTSWPLARSTAPQAAQGPRTSARGRPGRRPRQSRGWPAPFWRTCVRHGADHAERRIAREAEGPSLCNPQRRCSRRPTPRSLSRFQVRPVLHVDADAKHVQAQLHDMLRCCAVVSCAEVISQGHTKLPALVVMASEVVVAHPADKGQRHRQPPASPLQRGEGKGGAMHGRAKSAEGGRLTVCFPCRRCSDNPLGLLRAARAGEQPGG